ncbi:MAG TPA: phosphonate C-P lyase system protein PhnL [Stellaceae bacterium]|nr:phosphonate C-P lyase system protein PhnL [Stellaceae bacterium]
MRETLRVTGLAKSFTLHNQGGARLDVLRRLDLVLGEGECLVLAGPSGSGKSTLLRAVYGNYLPDAGHILLRHGGDTVDMARASPRLVLEVRRRTIGYVSQFLRVIPRVPALDIVAEPLLAQGIAPQAARERAADMLARLLIPERLWPLASATFSGGEQQRINVARVFAADYPILLLDEPTAALDDASAGVVAGLVEAARSRGATIIGVFHDGETRRRLADRVFDMASQRAIAA